MGRSLSAHIPDAELPQAERVLQASIVRLSQKVGGLSEADKREMERLRNILDSIRLRLGQTISPSGRLLVSDGGTVRKNAGQGAVPFMVANPNAVLDLGRDAQSGVAFRVDLSRG